MIKKLAGYPAAVSAVPSRFLRQSRLFQRLGLFQKQDLLSQEESRRLAQRQELKKQIDELLFQMELVQSQFENELDADLIEAHIWELHALEVRYQRVLRQMKGIY